MEAEPPAPRWSRIAREALPLVVLLAVAAKSTGDAWRAFDLMTSDETEYVAFAWLRSEPAVAPALESNPMYAPLYALWYRVLMAAPVGPEFLPYVGYGLLMTLLALLFYALVRRLGCGRWAAVIGATVFVLNTRLAQVMPLPVHLATALLAAGVLVGTYRRTALGACGPVGFAALIASYVRPEFGTALLAVLPLYLGAGLWACRTAGGRREFLPWAVPLLVSIGVCAATVGVPLPDGPRGLVAFAQHYAMNVALETGGDAEALQLHSDELLRSEFGDARSFGEAARARPRKVVWHVGCNLDRLPGVVLDLLQPRMEFAPTPQSAARILIMGAAGIGLLGTFRRAWFGGLRGAGGQPLRAVLVAAPLVALTSGASVALIFPRAHYLVLPLFFVLVLAAAGWPAVRWPTRWFGGPSRLKVRAAGCACAALLLAAAPSAAQRWTVLGPLRTKRPCPRSFAFRETMTLLRAVPRRPPTVVLAHHIGVIYPTLWMARPVHLVEPDLRGEGFRAFAARHEIGVVILDDRLRGDARLASDPEFLALWAETDTGAFAVLKSPGGYRVAVRRDLLAPE